MELLWTNELSVGNRAIDYAHKAVLRLINRIVSSIVAGDVADLPEAFQLLEKSLRTCFIVEEDIAQALNFDFIQHRRVHQSLLNEFRRIKYELMAKNGKLSKFDEEYYVDSLRYCLIKHIKVDGKPLKIVLETNFYDFYPDCANNTSLLHGCA